MEPSSSAVAQEEIAIFMGGPTDSAAASTEAADLELATRENPVVPHSARTR
jgi:hypothetical protein